MLSRKANNSNINLIDCRKGEDMNITVQKRKIKIYPELNKNLNLQNCKKNLYNPSNQP